MSPSSVLRSAVVAASLALCAASPADAAILPAIGGTAASGVDTPITGFSGGPAGLAPAGDVSGDGRADLIVGALPATVLFGAPSRAAIDAAAAASRTWSFASPWTDLLGRTYSVKLTPVGDVNADGREDLFAAPQRDGDTQRPAAPGDLLATIVAGRAGAGTTDLGDPAAVHTRIVNTAPGDTFVETPVAIGDHDGDGYDDFLLTWTGSGAGMTVLWGGAGLAGTVDLADPAERGYRVFAPEPASVPPGGGWPWEYALLQAPTGVGDVNGDGLDDFAVRRKILGGNSYAWFVYGSRNRAAGDLDLDARAGRASRVGPIDASSTFVRMGDLNGDRMQDVGVSQTPSTTVVLRGRTTTTDMAISSTFQRIDWSITATGKPGDVNGDGVPDVVGRGSEQVRFEYLNFALFGRSDGKSISLPPVGTPTTAGVRFPDPAFYSPVAAGDVDGDGLTDIATVGGLIYGYGAGTSPVPDTTAPTLAMKLGSGYFVYTCGFFAQRRVISAELTVDLSESATLEPVGVQNGVTRRGKVTAGPGQGLTVRLPKTLIAPSGGSVMVLATPVDAAGNRGAGRILSVPILSGGYRFIC